MTNVNFTIGRIATLACLLEVAAPKPGNVHRGADFEDVTLEDFLSSAVAMGQVIDEYVAASVGKTIKVAIDRTQAAAGTNTNLGMVLLIVPLAKAAIGSKKLKRKSVQKVLDALTPKDARQVYDAIRKAKPGGLGEVSHMDIAGSAKPVDLIEAMRLAEDRDSVARQYTSGFQDVFEVGVPLLVTGRKRFATLSQAIVFAHVSLMAKIPDSLIARKCGIQVAQHSQMLAAKAIDALESVGRTELTEEDPESYWGRVADLDFWLRSDGHKRNPGTTADLIAASLFAAITTGDLEPPYK